MKISKNLSKTYSLGGPIVLLLMLVSCDKDINGDLEGNIKRIIDKNPEIVLQALEKNPEQFYEVVQQAAKSAQQQREQELLKKEEEEFEKSFSNPLKPEITTSHRFRGPENAPITIVEYSDFECPFCKRGSQTIETLMGKYPGKIKLVMKHLPLSFHPQAMISAQYFEAIALQSTQKAFQFYDQIFENQKKLRQGESFLLEIAGSLNLDMQRLKSDINSDAIKKRIEKDIKEANKFNITGTPGFVLNGIPIRGAYPVEQFVKVINKLEQKGRISFNEHIQAKDSP